MEETMRPDFQNRQGKHRLRRFQHDAPDVPACFVLQLSRGVVFSFACVFPRSVLPFFSFDFSFAVCLILVAPAFICSGQSASSVGHRGGGEIMHEVVRGTLQARVLTMSETRTPVSSGTLSMVVFSAACPLSFLCLMPDAEVDLEVHVSRVWDQGDPLSNFWNFIVAIVAECSDDIDVCPRWMLRTTPSLPSAPLHSSLVYLSKNRSARTHFPAYQFFFPVNHPILPRLIARDPVLPSHG